VSADTSIIDAPLGLANVLTLILALICVEASWRQSAGGLFKRWRVALPAALAIAIALVLLAGVFNATLAHDAEWLIAAVLGAAIGRTRGWLTHMETDAARGIVRLPRTIDGLLVSLALAALSIVDFISAASDEPLVPPCYVAAGAAFCAGYLAFRALGMTLRSLRFPPRGLSGADSAP
jgi:hypothetical protein